MAQTSLKLEAYDGGYNTTGSPPDVAVVSEAQAVTTVFSVFGADNTPLESSDNPLLSTTTVATNDGTFKNVWKLLNTWTNPVAGTYYVRVKTSVQTTESRASNGFGIRAYTGGSFAVCTSIVGQLNYSATCPQIHGVGAMSIYANLGGASGTTASFYLAQVDPIHAGKTMQITLFDAGEGAQKIEVLDPLGNPATFSWTTRCSLPPAAAAGGCSGPNGTSLDVSGTGTQPYTGCRGTSKYNDSQDDARHQAAGQLHGGLSRECVVADPLHRGHDGDRPHHVGGEHRRRPGSPRRLMTLGRETSLNSRRFLPIHRGVRR